MTQQRQPPPLGRTACSRREVTGRARFFLSDFVLRNLLRGCGGSPWAPKGRFLLTLFCRWCCPAPFPLRTKAILVLHSSCSAVCQSGLAYGEAGTYLRQNGPRTQHAGHGRLPQRRDGLPVHRGSSFPEGVTEHSLEVFLWSYK